MWTDATVAMATNKYRLLWEYARMICTATHSLTHMYTYIHKCASEKKIDTSNTRTIQVDL